MATAFTMDRARSGSPCIEATGNLALAVSTDNILLIEFRLNHGNDCELLDRPVERLVADGNLEQYSAVAVDISNVHGGQLEILSQILKVSTPATQAFLIGSQEDHSFILDSLPQFALAESLEAVLSGPAADKFTVDETATSAACDVISPPIAWPEACLVTLLT